MLLHGTNVYALVRVTANKCMMDIMLLVYVMHSSIDYGELDCILDSICSLTSMRILDCHLYDHCILVSQTS